MPDTKITDLAALTGANIAVGDDFVLVDISDSTMAASGTDKRMLASELAIALATTLGIVGIDKIFTTVGDTVVGTGTSTSVRLAVGTGAGQAIAADPNATNKLSWQYPFDIGSAIRGTTSSLASTFDRAIVTETNDGQLATGRLNLHRIFLPKGLSITTISYFSFTTALTVGVNQWFALFDSSRNKLAITADDTSTAWAANTKKTLTVTGGPYVTTTTGWYYTGIMVKATTVPSLSAIGNGITNIRGLAPIPCGVADTGLTNPASCPATAAALTANIDLAYAEVA